MLFRWNQAARANKYHLQVSQDSTFSQLVYEKVMGNYIGLDLGGFHDAGTQYWWRLKAGNSLGWSNWSSPWTFTNGPSAIPSAPGLLLPADNGNDPGASVLFTWGQANRANNYHLQVSRDSGFTQLIFDEPLGNDIGTYLSPFPDNGGQYWWRVKAGNSLGWSSWATARTFTNGPSAIPDIPALSTPPNGSSSQGITILFTWGQANRANNYHLQVSQDSGFTQLIFDKPLGNYTGRYLSPFPDNGGQYWWRVKAGNSMGWSSWSSSWTFINGNLNRLPYPTGLTAVPGSGSAQVTIIWNYNSDPAVDYYTVSTGTQSGTYDTVYTNIPPDWNNEFTISGLTNNIPYYITMTVTSTYGIESLPSPEITVTPTIIGDDAQPTDPQNLIVSSDTNGNQLILSWAASTDDTAVSHYLIFRLTDNTSVSEYNYDFGFPKQSADTSYSDIEVKDQSIYSYRIQAVDTSDNYSGLSTTASASLTDTAAPSPPTNLRANPQNQSIDLGWDAPTANNDGSPLYSDDIDGYKIYRGTTSGSLSYLTFTLSTTHIDSGLTNGQVYYYAVSATDYNSNEGNLSAEVSATPGTSDLPPSAPVGVGVNEYANTLDIYWTANFESDIKGYNVYRGTVSGVYSPTPVNSALITNMYYYSDTSTSPGTTYYYSVTATDQTDQESVYSLEVSGMTGASVVEILSPTSASPYYLDVNSTDPRIEITYYLDPGYLSLYPNADILMNILDTGNVTVYTLTDPNPVPSGGAFNPTFEWNGKNLNGDIARAGSYSTQISVGGGVVASSAVTAAPASSTAVVKEVGNIDVSGVKIDSITISPGTETMPLLPVYNPAGIKKTGTAMYEASVEPASIPDSSITWSVVSGGVSFQGGNTGRQVTVAGNSNGEALLKVSTGVFSDTIDLKVADEKVVKLKIFVVRKTDSSSPATTVARINTDISDANFIWQQVAIRFVQDGAINYIDDDAWLEPDIDKRNAMRKYVSGTGAIEVYYVDKFTDKPLTTGTTTFYGVLLTDKANTRTFAHEIGHAMGLGHVSLSLGSNDKEKNLIKKILMFDSKNDYKVDISLGREWGQQVGWGDITRYDSD